MRLRLVKQSAEENGGDKGWRLLEHGELTLGRAADCGWVLVDPDLKVSGVHCRIVRDALGYSVRDESTNGVTVNGRALAHGETVRIGNGAVISFCGHRFTAEVTGEAEPDWVDPNENLELGDDALSITSILADVAPAGRTATSMLPGRLGDDWMDSIDVAQRRSSTEVEPPLTRAQVGWSGPPEEAILANAGTLPDDWNAEVTVPGRSEHIIATSTRVRTPVPSAPEQKAETPSVPSKSADDALDAFLDGLGETGAVIDDPTTHLRRMGEEMKSLRIALGEMEHEMDELIDEFSDVPAMPAAASLEARLAGAKRERERMVDAVRELLRDVDKLEPEAIERQALVEEDKARSVIERLSPATAKLRRSWERFRGIYRGKVSDGSPRARFIARLNGTSTPLDDEFEELSADSSRNDGKMT